MSEEKRKILEMLAEGKITAADAERLLDKLAALGSGNGGAEEAKAEEAATPKKQRYLRIVVDGPERDQVNVRVPLAFMRTGVKMLAILPPRVNERLAAKGIDLSALADLKGEELTEALQELNVDVDAHDGKKVRIFCE